MKMRRRILSIAVCLILTLNLFTPAFATTSQTFFREAHYGYLCTGTGSYSERECTASFSASEINNAPHIPPEECHCEAWVFAYKSDGTVSALEFNRGTTRVSATCSPEQTIDHIDCTFYFMGRDLGTYTLTV